MPNLLPVFKIRHRKMPYVSARFKAWAFVLAFTVLVIAKTGECQEATARARFYFNFGAAVDLELYGNESPLHVENFLWYVNSGSYDDSLIHRTASRNALGQVTALFNQGGSFLLPDNPNPANILSVDIQTVAPIANEFDPTNGLSNTPGTIAAARTSDPDSATSGWFVNVSNNGPGFDGQTAGTGFTVFGRVTSGFGLFSQVPLLPLLGEEFPDFSDSFQESLPLLGGTSAVLLTNAVEISLIDGDFNLDGIVNIQDFEFWQAGFGGSPQASDANADALINAADFVLLRDNFGLATSAASTSVGSILATPEPSTVGGAALLLLLTAAARRR